MTHDEKLTGGNVNEVIRRGDTVLRQTGPWSPAVHALLQHLERQGFTGAPRFLGVDGAGREILTFIPGEAAGDRYPELLPSYMWSDETLAGIARMLRSFHDATEGAADLLQAGGWQQRYADSSKHEVICHNDAALYNIVFQQEAPAAFIDFDMAGPGPRIWDIAYTVYTSVPLAGFAPDRSSGTTVPYRNELHADERGRRLRLFFETYGMSVPNDLKLWIVQRLTAMCDWLRIGAAEGNPAIRKMVEEGHLAHYEREIRFVSNHYDDWLK